MTSAFQKFFATILCFFMLNFSSLFSAKDKNMQIISDNIINGLLNGTLNTFSSSDIKDPDEIISLMTDDGKGGCRFTDIDYGNTDRATWPTSKHIARTERLALLYRKENDAEKREAYKQAALKLLTHWAENDYQNSNWWYNRLSNPNVVGEICLLMKNDISRKQMIKLTELVGRGSFNVTPVLYDHTGANAADLAMSSIKFGVLTGSKNAIKTAVKVVAETLEYTEGEGLNADFTFFQHGKRIYMGGYGIGYVNTLSILMKYLAGSDYLFTQPQLERYVAFILDGIRVMSFGNTLDPTVMGRSTSRYNAQPLNGFTYTLDELAAIEQMPRRDELAAYSNSIKNDIKEDKGIYYFDTAKFLVINTDDFYFSFKGGADDLFYSEIINNENILSYNSSVPGVTTIMTTGKEYRDISPVYDFSFVPGTTAVYETDEELTKHDDHTNRALPGIYCNTFDGENAILSAKTVHEGISTTVSCFAVSDAVILLGAGIKDKAGRDMNTTLDQCFYTGSFTCDNNTVIHNRIKYTVYEGGDLSADRKTVDGNWNRNNPTLGSSPASGDVFTVYLKNNGSYAYSVMSENTDAEFEIIKNTEDVQAVKLPNGKIAAAFFTNTAFEYNGINYSGKKGDAKIF